MNGYYYDICRICYDAAVKKSLNYLEFINAIVDLVVQEEGLNDYIKKVDIFEIVKKNNPKLKVFAEYCGNKKTITVNENLIKKRSVNRVNLYDFRYEEKLLFFHLNTVRILLHEIEHAKQRRIWFIEDSNYNIESEIIKTIYRRRINDYVVHNDLNVSRTKKCIKRFFSKMEYNIYQEFYNFSPNERLAQIRAYDQIIKIVHLLEFEELELYYTYEGYCEALKSYDITISPTLLYLECNGSYSKAEELYYKSLEMELIARLLYGLGINDDEYYSLCYDRDELKRTLEKNKFDINLTSLR